MNNILKAARYLSLPIGLTLAANILLFNIDKLPTNITAIFQYAPYVIFIIGMLLGLRFNKSKIFFLCLILGISQLAISTYSFESQAVIDTLSFLIPINIIFFSSFKERGILTSWGKLKLGFILLQGILTMLTLKPQADILEPFIYLKPLSLELLDRLSIPQASVLLYLLAVVYTGIKLYLKPSLLDSSLLASVLLTFNGFLFTKLALALDIFFTAASLSLAVGVIEASYFMAYKDELTGIPARRALKEAMLKLSGKYVIAMIDIDYFKKFNDTHGHDAGDQVLKMTASELQKVKGAGKAYRFGGEEFTILFPNKTLNEALPLLEELRKDIAKQKLEYKKKNIGNRKASSKQLSVTISIGAAEKSDKYKTSEEVLQAADKALYKAKKNGRNCVCR